MVEMCLSVRGMSHESLQFSQGSCLYQENTSDEWDKRDESISYILSPPVPLFRSDRHL